MAREARFAQSAEQTGRVVAWLTPEDPVRFAAFRVIFALVLLADITHLYGHRSLFSRMPSSAAPIGFVLVPWSIAVLCVLVGYQTRIATIANYLCCVLILGIMAPNHFAQTAGDSVAIGLSLLAVILPCGAVCALDRAGVQQKPQTTVAATRWLLAAYLSSIYIDSAFWKSVSPMWRSGFGITGPMSLPSLVWTNTAWLAWFPAPLLRIAGWGVIAFESSFPFLYAWRRTRFLAVWSGIALHAGIAVVYPFPAFSGLMISIYAGLLPDVCYAPLRRLDMRIALATKVRLRSRLSVVRLRPSYRLAVCAAGFWVLLIAGSYAPDAPRIAHSVFRKLGLLSIAPGGDASGPFAVNLARGIFVMTGITTHAVFGDGSFSTYTYQLRLTPVIASGDATAMPYSRNGLLAWSVRDRAWENWWKYTQAPWVPLNEAELRLAAWADFYWHPADRVSVRIEARPQHVELHEIDTELFSRNNAVAWRPVGTIRISNDAGAQIVWTDPPRPVEKRLGDYMSRIMTEHSD